MASEWFSDFVSAHLNFTGKCFRHCDKPTSMKIISQGTNRLVGAYVCPSGIVSHVVYFDLKPDMEWFHELLYSQLSRENVNRADIRIATRHGWERGGRAQEILEDRFGSRGSIKEVYWTRYPKTETQKQQAVSLCIGDSSRAGCLRLFSHDKNTHGELCPECGARYRMQ
jgi:hypothetical protein